MTSTLSSKHSISIVRKRIDDQTELYPLLDYSFHDAQKIEDAIFTKPRVAPGAPDVIKEGDRYHSYGINLNHNMLSGPLETFPKLVRMILIDPNALSTLDLSFNTFTEIPLVITQFPSLKYFYFHKNLLADITGIEKLLSLNELKYLTLHGNPIEINIPYLRSYVLYLLPGLRSFNCTPVSNGDRKIIDAWGEMNKIYYQNFGIKFLKNKILFSDKENMASAISSATPNAQTRRLSKDLEAYHENPLPFIQNLQYSVDNKGFNQLNGILIGPDHSSYANGYFCFRIEFPLEYPFKPHEFFFLTRICHPNVDTETGKACHDELLSSWTPKISITEIFTKMQSLLAQPDYNKFYGEKVVPGKDPETARQWTQEYAKAV